MAYILGGALTIWDTFPKASFGAIKFPVESSTIEGGLRDHVHEYPHTPGGAPEKLGRKLYTFKVNAVFDTNFDNYPGNYPQDLDTLLGNFEQQATQDLRLPQMATAVPCYAFQWTREQSAKVRSGERVSITFREDQSSLFLFADIVNQGTGSIEFANNNTNATLAEIQAQLAIPPATMNLFDALSAAVGQVLAIKDQALLYDARFGAMVAQVQNLCGQIESSVGVMQTIAAYPLLEALYQTWAAAQKLSQDLLSQGAVLQTWTNPITQDVGKISIQLYGDTSRVSDLLSLNPFTDSARVLAGTPVNYYPAH